MVWMLDGGLEGVLVRLMVVGMVVWLLVRLWVFWC